MIRHARSIYEEYKSICFVKSVRFVHTNDDSFGS